MPPKAFKRAADRAAASNKRVKVNNSQSQSELPVRTSPRKALEVAASQATEEAPFESQLRDLLPDNAIDPPTEGSRAATEASTEASDSYDGAELDSRFEDRHDGLDWAHIPRFMKPLRTLKGRKSWVFEHGYRIALIADPQRTFWICRHCYKHQRFEGKQALEVTLSTTAAITHMAQNRVGHRLNRQGQLAKAALPRGQTSLRLLSDSGVAVSQEVANQIGNFDVQGFRYAAVSWLVDNNHALREFETPAFREMIAYANPEAAEALWVSRTSVASFVMRLYCHLEPQVVNNLSQSISQIHISFDGWTTKGGKRGFFGIVAHYADACGNVRDLPIALPQLTGAHSGDRIADIVAKTLEQFSIDRSKLGYFVLDNASSNDRAVAKLSELYDFEAPYRRLRCAPHTLNLVGQTIMFGLDKEAYNGDSSNEQNTEARYLRDWRRDGPLGVLVDIINYIKTPQQHDLFASLQRSVNDRSHTETILEPIKPIITRWNSYHDAFERAVQLSETFNLYANTHINRIARDDAYAQSRGNKLPNAPSWMRSNGLKAADWAVITEYIEVLKPLKEATKRLEARGKQGSFGAIYDVIPVFEYVIGAYEAILRTYDHVDFNVHPEAPEDHLAINLNAAWRKANDYYTKLDASPAYYSATCLHPYYKNYCSNSWREKPHWIVSNEAELQQLWARYKPISLPITRPRPPRSGGIDDAIAALVNVEPENEVDISKIDELNRWRRYEPAWTKEQFEQEGNPVKYWISLRSRYPNLSRLAIDLLTIPASSCQCERLFSELGDLLEPRRRKIGSQLLAAIRCTRSWRRAGFKPPHNQEDSLTDQEMIRIYNIWEWENND
ncbi:hypothetical protein AA0113_g12768 [Alternaria arborescens]|uniref:HAT C-terminal dimerisation domain-containing protein n=3 Tax=Alternaria sect. Alternaria TaxID=2499237 RepID=A0A4Q4MV24_ALTAL|nr:hypothetical protein AA0115_g13014 [Alternaria tenuissima]RYN15733.1 hypothetical protein AA0112_g12726 [Alternaria arborescens]RYN60395.1 hypothetical protein AA0117_g13056 [Alternaria alternata]RYN35551.1 hypothetical protein AA0114_g11764 [Alternaria tenuissima]RYN85222.1 hypothetical protein AA0119_g13287 [Alternaria tenuissima]